MPSRGQSSGQGCRSRRGWSASSRASRGLLRSLPAALAFLSPQTGRSALATTREQKRRAALSGRLPFVQGGQVGLGPRSARLAAKAAVNGCASSTSSVSRPTSLQDAHRTIVCGVRNPRIWSSSRRRALEDRASDRAEPSSRQRRRPPALWAPSVSFIESYRLFEPFGERGARPAFARVGGGAAERFAAVDDRGTGRVGLVRLPGDGAILTHARL